jgi:hypothetical protein
MAAAGMLRLSAIVAVVMNPATIYDMDLNVSTSVTLNRSDL